MAFSTKTMIIFIVLLVCLYTTSAQVQLAFTLPWDSTLYSTPQILESKAKAVAATCTTESGKPAYTRLLGGPNVLTPRFFVSTAASDTFMNGCYLTLKETFPNIGATFTNGASCFNNAVNPSQIGFIAGTGGCPYPYNAACNANAVCADGTRCQNSVCSVVPILTTFDFTFSATVGPEEENPGDALKTIAYVKRVKNHMQNVQSSSDCSAIRASELISTADSQGVTLTNQVRVIVASDIALISACTTLITTIPAPVDGDTDPMYSSVTAGTISNLDKYCYVTNSNGFITTFNIGGSCSLTRPLGYTCSTTQSCPGSDSTCDPYVLSVGSTDICVLHKPEIYFSNHNIHVLTYQASILGAKVSAIADDFADKVLTDDCANEGVVPQSGRVGAFPQKIDAFYYRFVTRKPAGTALSEGCITALTTINPTRNPDMKTISYAPLDTSAGYPPFACLATRAETSPAAYYIDRIVTGGRCPWKIALTMACVTDLDCDKTSSTSCTAVSGGSICNRPGLIPDVTDLKLARIDIDATAYLGSNYGTGRLSLYAEKLRILCPFTAHLYNIGNRNYSKVNMWLTPFDYGACTQQMVQTAALQATQAALPTDGGGSAEHLVLNANLAEVHQVINDINSGAVFQAQSLNFKTLNEEGEEPTPKPEPEPVDPTSIIPRLKYASIKTFTKTLPLSCLDGSHVKCMTDEAECAVPCAWKSACIIDQHCGQFGHCSGGVCAQLGDAYLPPVQSASILSILVAIVVTLVGVFVV